MINDRYIGGAFSGSAMIVNNELYLVYTEHFEDLQNPPNIFIQKQFLIKRKDAIFSQSLQKIINRKSDFCSYNFRDPKVGYDILNAIIL